MLFGETYLKMNIIVKLKISNTVISMKVVECKIQFSFKWPWGWFYNLKLDTDVYNGSI
jgi:hypothetical protein